MQHVRHIMLYYFRKGKNATETQKICAVCGGDAVTDQTCQKWFVKFCAGHFLPDEAPQCGKPAEVDSDQMETLRSMFYHVGENRHTQNIQVNKVIGGNEKCAFYFMKKIPTDFLASPIVCLLEVESPTGHLSTKHLGGICDLQLCLGLESQSNGL